MDRSVNALSLALSATLLSLTLSCAHLPMDSGSEEGTAIIARSGYLEIRPTSGPVSDTGLVFYPGGFVDPRAYVAPLREFSRRGYVVLIASAPFGLAILDSGKAVRVVDRYREDSRTLSMSVPADWVGGGHSLGGTSAAILAHKRPGFFKGLVFLASYPADSSDLSSWPGAALSIAASEDGLATSDKIAAARRLLPAGTEYYEISGGSHAQFGNYGLQKGDGLALISPERQWQEAADVMERFFVYRGWQP